MDKVLVMMSTYNGHRYLREQLDSLLKQIDVDVHIIIRDDGSTDDTLNIINDYIMNNGNIKVLVGTNVGAAKSFHILSNYVIKEGIEFDYYAFCDQDDVWKENKLLLSCTALKVCSAKYQLYYGPATLVDCTLNPIGSSSGDIVNNLEANIFASRSLGCTQVFNKALLCQFVRLNDYIVTANQDEYIPLHDGWMSLIAYSLNADVVVGKEPLLYYRQHGKNVIGANDTLLKRTQKRLRRFNKRKCPKSSKCKLVLDTLGSDIPVNNTKILQLCATYKESWALRIRLAFNRRMYQYSIFDNLGFFAAVMQGKF